MPNLILSHARLLHVPILAAVLLAAGCTPTGTDDAETTRAPRAPGTERMVRRLATIIDNMPVMSNYFMNRERLAHLRTLEIPTDPQDRVRAELELANELLRAGYSQEAAERFAATLEEVTRDPSPHPDGLRDRIRSALATSYLRIAEQENCIERHGVDSCLMPIRGDGVHARERGSRAAKAVLAGMLEEDPADLTNLWIYNLVAMTLSEYPDDVPEKWLIPPETFASDNDVGRFYDMAPRVGLDAMGLAGGSVVEDFDGDGDLDVMASSWGISDQMRYFRNEPGADHRVAFEERTREAGLEGLVGGLNMIHADVDNDGDADVLVLRGAWMSRYGRHPNSLLLNDGHGFFEDVTDAAGLLSFHPTQAATWGDYDNDGWLDLYIGNESRGEAGRTASRAAAAGEVHRCELYRNNGPDADGLVTFTEVAKEAGVEAAGLVKGVAWGDYDNDGRLDLFVSRMSGHNLLYHNQGPGENGPGENGRPTFVEVGEEAGIGLPVDSFPTWFFDYDNDGWLDILAAGFATDFLDARANAVVEDYLGRPVEDGLVHLFRNNHDGTFTDVSEAVRVDHPMLVMGANYGDIDNDGWLDLYFGTGAPDYRALVPNRMFRNAEGKVFQDISTSGGFGHLQKGHGISFADIDNDGDQDVFAVMGGAFSGDVFHNVLFVNPGHGNSWVTLRLEGVRSNRAAVGGRIRVEAETPEGRRAVHVLVSTGGSFGSSSLQQEIGLGNATAIRAVEVWWPGGDKQIFDNVPIERVVRLREGDPEPVVVELERLSLPEGP